MKTFLIALFFLSSALAVWGEEPVAKAKADAEKCAEAVLKGDYEGIVLYTHARIVKMMGGKEAMIAKVKSGMEQMRSQGADFTGYTVGQPEDLKKIGAWLTCMVPENLQLKVPGAKVRTESKLLGFSEDEGKHWVFVDLGPVTKEQFGQVFPELDGKITFPEKKQPVIEKD